MRFNHMELTFARGTLDAQFREEIDAFYGAADFGNSPLSITEIPQLIAGVGSR